MAQNMRINLNDFNKDTLREIKAISDKHNGSREWLANIYYKDGKYVLGSPVLGTYSGVSMKPDEQSVKDRFATGMKECVGMGHDKGACKNIVQKQLPKSGSLFGSGDSNGQMGVTPEDLVATIHLHPIRKFETKGAKNIRSQFSGTDIGSEFAKAIRDGKSYPMFLTYPDAEGEGMFFGAGSGRRHNMLKLIVFPGKESYDIMKASNPHLSDEQIRSISPDGENINLVDWYAYQDESKRRGYLQELDIEKATGAEAYASYGNTYAGVAVGAVIAIIAVVFIINKLKKKKSQ